VATPSQFAPDHPAGLVRTIRSGTAKPASPIRIAISNNMPSEVSPIISSLEVNHEQRLLAFDLAGILALFFHPCRMLRR